MGRSYTRAQYAHLQRLQRLELDCKHSTRSGAPCRERARFLVQETVTDRNPDATVGGYYAPRTTGMRYCAIHWRSVLKMLAACGTLDGTDMTTVHPDSGQICVYHLATVRDLADPQ